MENSFFCLGGLGVVTPFEVSAILVKSRVQRGLPDGIHTAGVKGVTASEPLHTHPDPPDGSVTLHRFHHVFRAGRVEAAGGRQHRGDTELIQAQQSYGEPLHWRKRRSTSRSNSWNGASSALRRGLMTIDHCGFS